MSLIYLVISGILSVICIRAIFAVLEIKSYVIDIAKNQLVQTHLLAKMAKQSGVPADEVNNVLETLVKQGKKATKNP